MRLGILLPHFGHIATKERLIDRAPTWERWGFGSVWSRDNLFFRGHDFEPRGTRMVDPFTTLTAIGAVTQRLVLGTATIVPIRHPLVMAQLLGGVSFTAGAGRLVVGIGAGGQKSSFDAVDPSGELWARRTEVVKELAEVLRLSFSGEGVSYKGQFYEFSDVTMDPRPEADTPIWYGGSTPASVRRALEYCDGWFPGRCPMATLKDRLAQLAQGEESQGRRLARAIIPIFSLAPSKEEALAAVNVDGLLEEGRQRKFWKGDFSSVDELRGVLIAGTVDDCIQEIETLRDLGMDEVVFDFRMRPDDFDDQVQQVAEEILPKLAAPAQGAG